MTWHKDKYYGARAPFHYARGYWFVDFLYRGRRKTGRQWDDCWDRIIPTYAAACRSTRDPDLALARALAGVDVHALQSAWITWVRHHMKGARCQPRPQAIRPR